MIKIVTDGAADMPSEWEQAIEGIITDAAIPIAANLSPGAIGVVAYAADEIGRQPSTRQDGTGQL